MYWIIQPLAWALLAEKRSSAAPQSFCQLIKAKPEVVLSNINTPFAQ